MSLRSLSRALRTLPLAFGAPLVIAQATAADARCFRESNLRLPTVATVTATLSHGAGGQEI